MHGLKNAHLFRNHCLINGNWLKADDNKTIAVINPADNTVLGQVPDCGQAETARAIAAANHAYYTWRQLTPKERATYLLRWAALINENKLELARLLTLEQGKPFTEALTEIEYAHSFIEWYAHEAKRVYGDIIPANKAQERLFVLKQPIGVVAAITPWNFPSAMITRKIAPALAAGCTIVLKPAEETPFSALALAALAQEADLPAGVLNIITGNPAVIGEELTSNPIVKKLSFTGSTAVGKLLMAQSAGTIKKISLELGGNAPFLVFADADIDAAVAGLMKAKFRNTGQTCICANRIYVEDGIYDEFVKKVKKAVQKLKVSNGLDLDVDQGPLVNLNAVKKLEAHIEDAISKGAKLVCGGKRHALGGLFFEPTIIIDANNTMLLAQEETFGPIVPIFKFIDEAQAIRLANDTVFGLAAYLYSKDINKIWRVAEQLECGMIGINTGLISNEVAPFGGMKQSGIGREGSRYGIEEYIELKYMCLQLSY